jgi:hypothetical protein
VCIRGKYVAHWVRALALRELLLETPGVRIEHHVHQFLPDLEPDVVTSRNAVTNTLNLCLGNRSGQVEHYLCVYTLLLVRKHYCLE